jgi:hypothetical protein
MSAKQTDNVRAPRERVECFHSHSKFLKPIAHPSLSLAFVSTGRIGRLETDQRVEQLLEARARLVEPLENTRFEVSEARRLNHASGKSGSVRC